MTVLKKANIGDLLYVPSFLLFPQRTGRWTRHNFSVARVTGLYKHKKDGALIVEVEFYEAFRYRHGCKLQTRKFFIYECRKFDGFTPIKVAREKWDGYIKDLGCRIINEKLFSTYDADTIEQFGIEVTNHAAQTSKRPANQEDKKFEKTASNHTENT